MGSQHMPRSFILAGVLLGALGCEPTNRPTMNPGQDCLSCHCTGSPSCTASSLPWSAAGTVFRAPDSTVDQGLQGVHVLIRDALDAGVELVTNEVGNFYTAEKLQPPLTMQLVFQGQDAGLMAESASPEQIYGGGVSGHGLGCNGCHQAPDPSTGVPPTPPGGGVGLPPSGRIYVDLSP